MLHDITVKPFGGQSYNREDMIEMDKVVLGALLRERVLSLLGGQL